MSFVLPSNTSVKSAHNELYGEPAMRKRAIRAHGNIRHAKDRVLQAADHYGTNVVPTSVAQDTYTKIPSAVQVAAETGRQRRTAHKFLQSAHFKYGNEQSVDFRTTTQADFENSTRQRSVKARMIDSHGTSSIPVLSAQLRDKTPDVIQSSYNSHYRTQAQHDKSRTFDLSSSVFRLHNSKYLKATHFTLGSDTMKGGSETKSSYQTKPVPTKFKAPSDRHVSNVFVEDDNIKHEKPPLPLSRADYLPPPPGNDAAVVSAIVAADRHRNEKFLKSAHFSVGNEKGVTQTNYDRAYNLSIAGNIPHKADSFKHQQTSMSQDPIRHDDKEQRHSTSNASAFVALNVPKKQKTRTGQHKSSLSMGNPADAKELRMSTVTADDYQARQRVETNKPLALPNYRLFNDKNPSKPTTTMQDSYRQSSAGPSPAYVPAANLASTWHKLRKTHFVLGSDEPSWASDIQRNFPKYTNYHVRPAPVSAAVKYKHVIPDMPADECEAQVITTIRADYQPINRQRIKDEELRNRTIRKPYAHAVGAHYFHLNYDGDEHKSTTNDHFGIPAHTLASTLPSSHA